VPASAATLAAGVQSRPPGWLIAATGALAAGCLAMAVAETNLWLHYLIDAGESVSLIGLAFMLAAGFYLFRQRQLLVSLPLAVPWLLFPVITQGDQIIDNLSIDWMRLITHMLLGLIFGTPVAIVVMAAARFATTAGTAGGGSRWLALVPGLPQMAQGRVREGRATLAVLLLVLEMWVAVRFLGLLMVATLVVMIWGVLVYASLPGDARSAAARGRRSETFALWVLVAGVAASLGLFFGYKNRPGAYQGSPSYFMDPAQRDAGFRLDRVAVPTRPPVAPADPESVRVALTGSARALQRLLDGYYVLDRNYNYDFHNHLFLRSTPLLPHYRSEGLRIVADAEAMRTAADAAVLAARPTLEADDPLGALLDDVHGYVAFTFARAPVLERMSAGFERTQAGLQHATHLYEGEGKVLGVQLAAIADKHKAVTSDPLTAAVTADFVTLSRAVHEKYANRVVGF
jgi:hypothetical protein